MDIEDLQTFVEIAKAGGISLAARRLAVSKSIVSRRLARLEEELGTQLIARTTRGAALTDAGTIFLEHAAGAVAEMEAARDAILPAGDLRGLFRVSVPVSLGPAHLAPVLIELARQNPALRISTSHSDHFVDIVGEGFDCAVRIGQLPDSSLQARRVGLVRTRIVASPDYVRAHGAPETFEELARHEALLQGTETWQFIEDGKRQVFRPHGRYKADSGHALTSAALAGLGVAALPDFLIRKLLIAGDLVPVMQRHRLVDVGVFVVRPPGASPTRKVTTFTDMLIAHFTASQGEC